jgi:hypothetical protein
MCTLHRSRLHTLYKCFLDNCSRNYRIRVLSKICVFAIPLSALFSISTLITLWCSPPRARLAALRAPPLRRNYKQTLHPQASRPPSTHMNWSAAVLTGVTSDTEPTIVVAFDSAKYIFNVGENTSRAFLQSRQNWRKTRSVFLSSVGTQRASGLPGKMHARLASCPEFLPR